MTKSPITRFVTLIAIASLAIHPASAAAQALPASQRLAIDSAVATVLASTGAPGASIAIVRDGKIAYERAYGTARVAPAEAARPAMRYEIGSVTKQFVAAAVLLLVEDQRLSLDDKV